MSSRDPRELRTDLQATSFEGDEQLLSELRSEARETVDAQRATLQDVDTKASRILRLNVLLLGVLVSAFSIAARTAGARSPGASPVDPLVNVYVGAGVASLVVSTALAAMTYTASELDVGVSSDNLANLLGSGMARREVQELLVKNYTIRINFNRSTNIRNIPLVSSTIVFVVASVVLFAVGLYEAVAGSVPWWLSVLAFLLVASVVRASGLVTQTERAVSDVLEWR